MPTHIRNLNGHEIRLDCADDALLGARYLDAEDTGEPGISTYYAPETRRNYRVSSTDLEALGRVVRAIANNDPSLLEDDNERLFFSDNDGDEPLCDLGFAYSIWCAATNAEEVPIYESLVSGWPPAPHHVAVTNDGIVIGADLSEEQRDVAMSKGKLFLAAKQAGVVGSPLYRTAKGEL